MEMYIIRKGNVAVVGKHNQLMSILGPGENFGEIALLTQVSLWVSRESRLPFVCAQPGLGSWTGTPRKWDGGLS